MKMPVGVSLILEIEMDSTELLEGFEKVDNDSIEKWMQSLSLLNEGLSKAANEVISKRRERNAKTDALSRLITFG